jgi:hypothetical protein|tara:strand:+ start:1432 stop:2064 length:633 start_codon:yes stop_codon:yes gene_type:complete
MQASLILFPVGAGGNFLSRVLSLDENTVPIGGYTEGKFLSTKHRAERYHYRQVINKTGNDFSTILDNGLTKWVDYELNNMYFPLTFGMEKLVSLDQHIVEPLHLWHLEDKIQLFGKDDDITLYFVDCNDEEEWVHKQASTKSTVKNLQDTLAACNELHDYAIENKLQGVRLSGILHNFDQEYIRFCAILGIRPYPEHAKVIYESWKLTWQ